MFTLDIRIAYAELTQQTDLFVFVKGRPITEISWFVCVAFSVWTYTVFRHESGMQNNAEMNVNALRRAAAQFSSDDGRCSRQNRQLSDFKNRRN